MEPGNKLGHYEILSAIGKGGMGEVWKARDTRLGRDVAIKTLPRDMEQNADWLSRFEREAKVLASLNHPNIAAIHGFDRDQGFHFLVLELVGGDTLADRLHKGPLPIDEALAIARQIADALEAAHENGVIHRDLKPANVKITDEGVVKVLDFGLARALWAEDTSGSSSGDSPTLSLETREGAILGTAAYMAPEQARGKRVDKRADVWAFGVVLFEMVTGVRPFEGSDLTETLASVVMKPVDFEVVPWRLRRLVRKCLERDPKKRLRDIGDAWELLEENPQPAAVDTQAGARRSALPWLVASMFGVAALAFAFLWLRPAPSPTMVRFDIHPPPGAIIPVGTPAVSPDGTTLAYVVQDSDGISRIHIRPIDQIETRALPGTEEAAHPFWSPDGRSLAFVARNMLKRIDLAGGTARDIARVGGPWHGAFSGTGQLLGLSQGILLRVSDQGGTPKAVEGSDRDTFPTFLSDGKRYLVRSITEKGSAIQLATLGAEPRTLVLDNVLSAPVFAPTPSGKSYLLFLRDADLMAQEFDEDRGAVVGEAVVLVRRIGRVANPEVMPAVGVSRSGILAYQSADAAPLGQLTWLDRAGLPVSTLPTELAVLNPRISPDGSFIVGERPSGGRDIWVVNLKRGTTTKVTVDETLDSRALWSPDGNRVAFSRAEKGILAVDFTGAGSPTMLTEVAGTPTSWSPDGNHLLYNDQGKLFLLEIATKKTAAVGALNGASSNGKFSPDGKYIAYTSNESGRPEVYVQPMPPGTGRTQVSVKGGVQPRWSDNGREIFFLSPEDMMMVADVTTGQVVSASVPRPLFKFTGKTSFDVSRDGQRFLVLIPPKEIDAPITVVMNWWLGLERTPR